MAFEIQEYMHDRMPLVDSALQKLVPGVDEPPTALHGAMRHLLFPGGKRFRSMLALAGAEAVGGTPQDALPVACAVELIHSYSLIHDDLPCMDDDATRRGQPTVHVVYGEAVAVLAGDALQSLAFEGLAAAAVAGRADVLSLALRDLAVAAGSRQLVGGQADDLLVDTAKMTAGEIERVHARKTAALIGAAVVAGARLGGASARQVEALQLFGNEVGVAFQIADDLLDASEDEPSSLVPILGEAGARARADGLLTTALARIEAFPGSAAPLRALARFAVQRTR